MALYLKEPTLPALTEEETAHAASITEPATVVPIPPAKIHRILIGAVIRKPRIVLEAFFHTISQQLLDKTVEVSYLFLTDFAASDTFADDSLKALSIFCASVPRATFVQHHSNLGTDYGDGPTTRLWSGTAFARMGVLKNQIIQHALTEGYDALWLIDADVLCDSTTLQSLRDCEQPIVAGVYWTQWQRPTAGEAAVVHAGPQVWLRHPYHLDGHGYTEADFRKALIDRKLVRVWGLGACTLFQRAALEKGVHFAPVPEGLPAGPMAEGEDRHLCERARRLHIPLYADSWPDILHAYHPQEYGDIERWLGRCASPRLVTANFGDLVSLRVQNLEQPELPPQWVRGRLGSLGTVPEIEETAAALSVRDARIVCVHFPAHYPFGPYRNRSLLFQVKLLDAKPFQIAPIISRELLVGAKTGARIDVTTLTAPQVESVLEEASAQ